MDANNKDLENRVVALEIFVERLKAGAGEVAALPDDVTFKKLLEVLKRFAGRVVGKSKP